MSNQTFGQYNPQRDSRWEDWINALLAIWFFLSPWILQFGSRAHTSMTTGVAGMASWNVWVLSVIVFLVAISAIGRLNLWQEWVNLLLGIWIFIAPWVLNFATGRYQAAAWDHWIIGALVFIFSGITLIEFQPGRDAAG